MRLLLVTFAAVMTFGCTKSNNAQPANAGDSIKSVTLLNPGDVTSQFIPSQIDNVKSNSLFVFVGEKIEVVELPDREGAFDNAFLAKYKVLDKYYGDYLKDTIEFEVYDHYGEPAFSRHNVVLLFVSFHEGEFYHEKYQYFDLYRAKNGKWARPYSTGDYRHEYNRSTPVKPEKIEFAHDVYYDVSGLGKKAINEWYPAPYYRTTGSKAKAIYGNYVPELFKLKRNGILKACGLF
jgi:hypothetical protein